MRLSQLFQFLVFACLLVAVISSHAAPGDVDSTFPNRNFPDIVNVITMQSDGKALCGGYFGYVIRINSDGSFDTNFALPTISGGAPNIHSIVIQPDNKIVVAGTFYTIGGSNRNYIARLNTNGTVDATFDPGTGPNNSILGLALQPDGKILIGGNFTSVDGTNRNHIARLNADGSLDVTFDPGTGASGRVHSIVVQPDGRILVGGIFTSFNGSNCVYVARLNSGGDLDTSFNSAIQALPPTFLQGAFCLALQPDGKLLAGGSFTNVAGLTQHDITRLNTDGTLDTNFNLSPGPSNAVYSVAVEADGKVLIGGMFTSVNGVSRHGIARLNSDGTLDVSFDQLDAFFPGTDGIVYSFALQSPGKALIGGDFTAVQNTARSYIARIILVDAPTLSGPSIMADGTVRLTGWADTNSYLQIDGSSNLADWVPLNRFTNSQGTFIFDDSTANIYPCRFYRAEVLP